MWHGPPRKSWTQLNIIFSPFSKSCPNPTDSMNLSSQTRTITKDHWKTKTKCWILWNIFLGKVQMFMLAPLTPEKLLFNIFKSTNNAVSSDYERKEFLFTYELFLSNHLCIFLYGANEYIMAFLHCWLNNEHLAKHPDHTTSCLDSGSSWANTESTIPHTTHASQS